MRGGVGRRLRCRRAAARAAHFAGLRQLAPLQWPAPRSRRPTCNFHPACRCCCRPPHPRRKTAWLSQATCSAAQRGAGGGQTASGRYGGWAAAVRRLGPGSAAARPQALMQLRRECCRLPAGCWMDAHTPRRGYRHIKGHHGTSRVCRSGGGQQRRRLSAPLGLAVGWRWLRRCC